MAAYRAETGEYPKTLAELSPAYLPEIPQDIFSSKPLIYRPTDSGYVLYSVGENMTDDGGVDESEWMKGDIVVEARHATAGAQRGEN